MLLGVIADDLTGATDIAGFLASNGLDTIQLMGLPDSNLRIDAEAAVVSLKSRSVPAAEAVAASLAALQWLQDNGCPQFYFKYCSTFDSTSKGNIGPVTDALLDSLASDLSVVCPSLPVNGRVVRDGILLVNGTPLSETGMRHHPVTPMTDSNLINLMEMQSRGKAGLVGWTVVERGPAAVREELTRLRRETFRYAILDAVTDAHLDVLAEAVSDMPLLTGGSGLAGACARFMRADGRTAGKKSLLGRPPGGKAVILSGSCSEMTNKQVAAYRLDAESAKVSAERCVDDPDGYAEELARWTETRAPSRLAPLV